MAWQGYFEYDGNEIVNVARTQTYLEGAGWFRPLYDGSSLPLVLGVNHGYTSPLIDDAPWVDGDRIESLDFYGFYPLDVTGLEDSTVAAATIESLDDGGIPGRMRSATRSIVFNGLIFAATDAAAEYGMQWLKLALGGSACGSATEGLGANLCLLYAEPYVDRTNETAVIPVAVLDAGDAYTETPEGTYDGLSAFDDVFPPADGGPAAPVMILPEPDYTGCLDDYLRTFQRVAFNPGPQVTAKRVTTDGTQVWAVQFTAVAGDPKMISAEVPVISGFLDPQVPVPWADGVEPEDAVIDLDGFIYPETACAVPQVAPIFDPLSPALVPPPGPPTVPLGNFVPPVNWRRRQFTIPKQYVPLWGEVVPKVEVHARYGELRNLRLRFYADAFDVGDISDDPCAYCGDIIISYVPLDNTLVFDAAARRVYVVTPGGQQRRADSLVFRSDGTPFEWPALTCGAGFVVTLDLPQTQIPPVVDLSLFSRAA
jgi:hypothetical protein